MKHFVAAALLAWAGCAATAQEVTLRAVNAFQGGTYFAKDFEAFVEKVNAEGKGIVQIRLVGGPEAIPTMEQGAALMNGVVDLAHTTAAYTASIVPEVLAYNYATLPFSELRKNGTVDFVNGIMGKKKLMYFARTGDLINYHIYLTRPVEAPDLTGRKMRIAPNFRPFFQAMGADVVQIPPGEVFTALERGVVDGYGWPLLGIFDMGWQEVTKYRVDPGFYMLELGIQFNTDSWAKLTPEQKAFLEKQRDWLEERAVANSLAAVETDTRRQAEAGIQTITFTPEVTAAYQKLSQDAAWDGLIKTAPENGPKLRAMMAP